MELATFASPTLRMELLLVSATAMEIRPFLQRMTLAEVIDEERTAYRYRDVNMDVLIPGVGMVATAYHLGRLFKHRSYDLAINAGIAGTFDRSIAVGSVVHVTSDCIPELGAEDGEQFLTLFDLGLTDPDSPPYRQGRLWHSLPENLPSPARAVLERLPGVSAITSNTVRGNDDSIARIRKLAPAALEGMEGAAFFYACLSAGVPCIQIRAISNYIERRDRSRWDLRLALKNLNRSLGEIVRACAG